MIAFALVEQEEPDIKRLQGRLIERQRSFDIADSQNPVVEFQSSGSCEEIGRRIKVATVVEMVQPLDCKREPITRSSTPGID
jgi:hypothetical protein